MRTTSVQNRAGRCGKVFQEMAEMLREGCGKVNSLLRDSVTQVLDFIAGRSGHFCGKVRVAVSFPLKGEYPAGLLEVGPAGYPTWGMVAACSEMDVPVLKPGVALGLTLWVFAAGLALALITIGLLGMAGRV